MGAGGLEPLDKACHTLAVLLSIPGDAAVARLRYWSRFEDSVVEIFPKHPVGSLLSGHGLFVRGKTVRQAW
jgi:ribulose-5-phosphate 4-epimerase/fuculose-1-phosphate aldolase